MVAQLMHNSWCNLQPQSFLCAFGPKFASKRLLDCVHSSDEETLGSQLPSQSPFFLSVIVTFYYNSVRHHECL